MQVYKHCFRHIWYNAFVMKMKKEISDNYIDDMIKCYKMREY